MGLIRSLGGKEDNKREKGKNYIFKVKLQHAPDLDIIKVGFTKRDVSRRQSNIKSRCNIETTCQMISTERHIQHYKKAESLIKADLRNWLHEFECECGQSHTEYFAITFDMAWEITSRWKDFCEADPWTDKGNLHPFWDDRLNNVYGAGEDDKNNDWNSRSVRWTEFTRPTGWDFFKFNLTCFGRSIWARIERWVVFILAVALSWVTYPSGFSFGLLSLVSLIMMAMFTFDETPFVANSVRPRSAAKKAPESGTSETQPQHEAASDAGEDERDAKREDSVLDPEGDCDTLETNEKVNTENTVGRIVVEEQDDGEFKDVIHLD